MLIDRSNPFGVLAAIIRNPLVIAPTASLMTAIALMNEMAECDAERASCVVVVHEESVVGIISERDIVRLSSSQQPLHHLTVQAVMIQSVVTLPESQLTDQFVAMRLLQQQQIWHLPLVDADNHLVGLLTYESLCKAQLQAGLAIGPTTEVASGQSEATFRRFVEGGRDVAWEIDAAGLFTYISPQFKTLFGWEPQDWIGKCAIEIAYPDDRAWLTQEMLSLQNQTSTQTHVEYRGLHQNQPYIWLRASLTSMFDASGAFMGCHGNLTDISSLKNAELALKDSERRYATLTATAPVAIFQFDQDGKAVYVNDHWSKMTGRPKALALGLGWLEAVHPDERERAIANWTLLRQQTAAGLTGRQIMHRREGRHLRPDGSINWFDIQIVREFDNSGNIIGYIGTLTDITDRKQAEQRLQKLSERLEMAIQSAHIGIWEYDFARRKLSWDEPMFGIYGKSPENFQGIYEDWANCVHPDDLDEAQKDIHSDDRPSEKIALAGQQRHYPTKEFRVIHPDGSIRYLLASALIEWDDQGNRLRAVGTNLDITDRKQAEAQLQRTNEELLRATRLKDEFLANMSHELRTPLNAILGRSEILEEQIFGPLNDRQIKSLKAIEKSSNHLLELINDILDVAKIEAGQTVLTCSTTDIRKLCESSLAFIKQQALNKRIQLDLRLPDNLPAVYLDERRIRQVLINLLNNAVKFTPIGGCITFQVEYDPPPPITATMAATQTAFQSQGYDWHCDTLILRVSDTGIGIAPDNIKQLFQPFQQIDSALNRQYNGTGLGLALVKRLVELHGGQVSLTSEVNVGSCFTIALPACPPKATVDEAIAAAIATPSSINFDIDEASRPLVLLVEDNESNVQTMTDYLSAKGFRIMVAYNGQTAIDLVQQQPPDVILMDIQMPGMDGLEAIQRIRQDLNCTQIPVIALTALAMPGDRERCLAIGASEYLSKPVILKQLVTTIQTWLT